jgi:hypothetical protein
MHTSPVPRSPLAQPVERAYRYTATHIQIQQRTFSGPFRHPWDPQRMGSTAKRPRHLARRVTLALAHALSGTLAV